MTARSHPLALRLAAALVLALSLTAAAAAAPEPAAAAAGKEGSLDQRIDIQLSKAKAVEVFKSFAQMVHLEPAVDPELRKELSLQLENVRVRTALDVACESLACRWSVEEEAGKPRRLVVRALLAKPEVKAEVYEPIDLRVTGADVRDVLRTFGQLAQAEAVIDPAVEGKLTLEIFAQPWNKVLDAVCQRVGCEWSLVLGEKRLLKVTAKTGRKAS